MDTTLPPHPSTSTSFKWLEESLDSHLINLTTLPENSELAESCGTPDTSFGSSVCKGTSELGKRCDDTTSGMSTSLSSSTKGSFLGSRTIPEWFNMTEQWWDSTLTKSLCQRALAVDPLASSDVDWRRARLRHTKGMYANRATRGLARVSKRSALLRLSFPSDLEDMYDYLYAPS